MVKEKFALGDLIQTTRGEKDYTGRLIEILEESLTLCDGITHWILPKIGNCQPVRVKLHLKCPKHI